MIKENSVFLNIFGLIQVALYSCVFLNFTVSVPTAHKGPLSVDESHAKRMLKLLPYSLKCFGRSNTFRSLSSRQLIKEIWSPAAPFKQY